MTDDAIRVAFVIPAYNEAAEIAETLDAITGGSLDVSYEILVVDNGSEDDTADIARRHGARVVSQQGGTISSVRNTGVRKTSGDIIVFLDADVSLTQQWFRRFPSAMQRLGKNPFIITGSRCRTPENGNWLERYWFGNFRDSASLAHLGSGHMILTRKLFNSVGGFDVSLATGEDYEFCQRAMMNGATLEPDSDLYVVHRDYPSSSYEFIRREVWHGTGDSKSLQTVLRSKAAIMALLFLCLHLVLAASVAFDSIPVAVGYAAVMAIVMQMLVVSWMKFGGCGMLTVLVNGYIFYLYFIGRSISLFARPAGK